MRKPQKFFVLIGAPKSGTTAVANWLAKRSDIRMSPHKEPRFFTDFADVAWTGPNSRRFSNGICTDEAEFLASFGDCGPDDWAIDASTDYLWCPAAFDRLSEWGTRHKLKLACILRDPVDRAVSEYEHTIRDLMQDGSLLASLQQEDERFEAKWLPLFYHVRRSRYFEAVNRYRARFGDDFMMLDYAALKAPDALQDKLVQFLDLPPEEIAAPQRENVAAGYRSPLLARMLSDKSKRPPIGKLLPKALRHRVWQMVKKMNSAPDKYKPTAQELDFLRSALADDIANCRADPYFPTESWTA